MVRHGENGLVVRTGDALALGEAALRLLSDENLRVRLGALARGDALQRSWEKILDGLLDDYEQVLEEKKPTDAVLSSR